MDETMNRHEHLGSDGRAADPTAPDDVRTRRRALGLRIVLSVIVYFWILVSLGYVTTAKADALDPTAVGPAPGAAAPRLGASEPPGL